MMKQPLLTPEQSRAELAGFTPRLQALTTATPEADVRAFYDQVQATLARTHMEDPSEGELYHLSIKLRDCLKTYTPQHRHQQLTARRDLLLVKATQAREELEELESDVRREWEEAEPGTAHEKSLDQLLDQCQDARASLEAAETTLATLPTEQDDTEQDDTE